MVTLLEKYEFIKHEIEFLGFIIRVYEIKINLKRLR